MKPLKFDYSSLMLSDTMALKISGLEAYDGRTTDPVANGQFYRDALLHDAHRKATPFFLAMLRSPKCYPAAVRWMINDKTATIIDERHVEYRYVNQDAEAFIFEVRIQNPDIQSENPQNCNITGVWPTTKWLPPRHFWAWYWNKEERYQEDRKHTDGTTNVKWSPVLAILGWILFWLRRFNLFEFVKHWSPPISGLNQTPARTLDYYLLLFIWPVLGGTTWYLSKHHAESSPPFKYLPWFLGFFIAQIIQTSVYHELWRTLRRSPIATERRVHSRLRNAVIGFLNVVAVTILFGLIYYSSNAFELEVQRGEASEYHKPDVLESIYFSYTVAWSVGPVGMSPTLTASGNAIIMLQAASTLLLVGVLLSLVVSGIRPLEEAE